MPLLDKSGRVIGAFDGCNDGFDILGRRAYRPRARPAPRTRPAAAADREVTIDAPKMQDMLSGYKRLR